MPYIEIDAQRYDFSEIKKSNIGKHPALVFCYYWLNGQKTFLLQTSGSTGEPKIISISREQMMISATGTIQALGLTKEDKALVCLNTDYIGGMMMMVRGMVLGMDMLLLSPENNPLERVPASFSPTFVALVPLQVSKAIANPESKKILDEMHSIIIGGAAIDPALEDDLQKVLSPAYSTYGMTETVSHIALRRLNGEERSENYKILENIEIALNEHDCLKIRGAVTQGRWLQTNDIVQIQEDKQRFIWEGRADLTINSGGVKVPISTIERVINTWLLQNRKREKVIAVGMPDPSFGEIVSLVIEGNDTPEWLPSLQLSLNQQLTKYQLPKKVFTYPSFPKTPNDKLDRKALVKELLSKHTVT